MWFRSLLWSGCAASLKDRRRAIRIRGPARFRGFYARFEWRLKVFASSGDRLKVASSFEAAQKNRNPDPGTSNLCGEPAQYLTMSDRRKQFPFTEFEPKWREYWEKS